MASVKALHLLPPGFGGIDAYVFSHYKYMDPEKFQFDFITQNPGLEKAEQYRDFRYKTHLIRPASALGKERFITQIKGIYQRGYDIVHLHTSYWTGFLLEELAKEVGIPKIIVHSHSSFIDEADEEKREKLLRRHESLKQSFALELATDFWACSEIAADWLFDPRIPRNRIQIMKNAIDVEKYRYDAQSRATVRGKLGLEDTLVLGVVGRLSYQKNHEFLIDVFFRFHQRHPKSRLVILGDGELRNAVERQIETYRLEDDVLLLGWQNDVEKYLQAMDIFFLPSRFEGLGIAAVEAAASGLPCIVSDQVPEDVVFTDNTRRLPLDIEIWIKTLEDLTGRSVNRQEGAGAVRGAGYDLRQQAKILEALYEK